MGCPELGKCRVNGRLFVVNAVASVFAPVLSSLTSLVGLLQFDGASRFEQNLCEWYSSISMTLIVTNMFEGTRCSMPEPDLDTGSSFCMPCGNRYRELRAG